MTMTFVTANSETKGSKSDSRENAQYFLTARSSVRWSGPLPMHCAQSAAIYTPLQHPPRVHGLSGTPVCTDTKNPAPTQGGAGRGLIAGQSHFRFGRGALR